MMRSLFSGVSGLKSHQTRMDVIGNNISNINTVGFKSSRTTFADMLSQTSKGASSPSSNVGGTNPTQIGLGAAVASVDLITNDGSPQATGKNTDVALSGNGMFVMKRGDSYYYTRDGAFEFDNDGNYVLPGSGLYVQGWNAVEGSLNTNADPSNIVVPAGRAMAATATTSVDFSGNLNASSPTIKSITYTVGGSGTDETLVVNQYKISEMTYDAVWSATAVTSGTSTYKIGDTGSNNKLTGAVTTIKLTLSNGNTIDITGGSTEYKIGDYYTSGDSTTAITSIQCVYTAKKQALPSGTSEVTLGDTITDTNIVASGSSAIITGAHFKLYDSTFDPDPTNPTILEDDEEVTWDGTASGKKTYKVGDLYGTESVNVDGTNVIAAILNLSDGSTQKVTSGFYEVGHSIPVTTTVTIYDSEGKTHAVTMLIDKDPLSSDSSANATAQSLGNDNRWRIYLSPATGKKGPATLYSRTETDGSKTDGHFNQTESNSEGTVSYIYFNSDGSYNASATSGGTMLLEYSNGNGAASTTSAVNFTGLTQYSGNSTAYPTADGNSFGVLQSISIDNSGVLTGTYTNGVLRFEAQLAVAQFINSAGLTKVGTSLYQESNNSGTANIKTVTDLGLTVTPSALEMSNVDLASELADMIVTQRGFQSNSKIITVGDEMLETLINMKR